MFYLNWVLENQSNISSISPIVLHLYYKNKSPQDKCIYYVSSFLPSRTILVHLTIFLEKSFETFTINDFTKWSLSNFFPHCFPQKLIILMRKFDQFVVWKKDYNEAANDNVLQLFICEIWLL